MVPPSVVLSKSVANHLIYADMHSSMASCDKGVEGSSVKKIYFRGNSEKRVQDSTVAVFRLRVDRTGTMVFKMVYNTGQFSECAGMGHASFNGLVVTRIGTTTSTSTTTTSTTATTVTSTTTTITTATSITTTTTTLTNQSNISNNSDADNLGGKNAAAAAVVPIVVLLLLAAGLMWRRYAVQQHAETVRANRAMRELDGADVLEMVENPLRRPTAGAEAMPTYENVAQQQLQPTNDRVDVPPPLIPGSRHGAPRATEPQLYSNPADLDPASMYKSLADADVAVAGVQVQAQVYSVPTDGGNADLYQPADGGHAYAESSTLNNGGDAGEGDGVEYATVHEVNDGMYSNA